MKKERLSRNGEESFTDRGEMDGIGTSSSME